MNTTGRHFLPLVLSLACACADVDTPDEPLAASEHAIEPTTVLSVMATVAGKIYEQMSAEEKAAQIAAHLWTLDWQVRDLQNQLTNLSYWAKRGDDIRRIESINDKRIAVKNALEGILAHPESPWTYENTARIAAEQLGEWTYYTYAGRSATSPDRFDPRGIVPSFIWAVTEWVAIRERAGWALDATSRDKLVDYAYKLFALADRTTASITCYDEQEQEGGECAEERPRPCTPLACRHTKWCWDAIGERTITLEVSSWRGRCNQVFSNLDSGLSQYVSNRDYGTNYVYDVGWHWLTYAWR
jgi:hypothetical protein